MELCQTINQSYCYTLRSVLISYLLSFQSSRHYSNVMYVNPAHFDVASKSFEHFYMFHAVTTCYKIKTTHDRVLEFSYHEDECKTLNIRYRHNCRRIISHTRKVFEVYSLQSSLSARSGCYSSSLFACTKSSAPSWQVYPWLIWTQHVKHFYYISDLVPVGFFSIFEANKHF